MYFFLALAAAVSAFESPRRRAVATGSPGGKVSLRPSTASGGPGHEFQSAQPRVGNPTTG